MTDGQLVLPCGASHREEGGLVPVLKGSATSKFRGELPRSALIEEITAGGSLPPRDDDAGLLPPPMSGQGLVSIGVEAGTEQQAGQAAGLSPKHHWPPAARQKEKREKPPQLQVKIGRSQSNQSRVPAMDQGSVVAAAIEAGVGQVRSLGIDALRQRWRLMFGAAAPKGLTKDVIGRVIAYRIQEEALGGLDRETVKLLDRLARGRTPDGLIRRLKAGTVLVREYQGERHTVTVVPGGFSWQDSTYSSLSAIARAMTGTAWNGPRFFGLRVPGTPEARAATAAKPPPPQAAKSAKRSRSSVRPSGTAGTSRGADHG